MKRILMTALLVTVALPVGAQMYGGGFRGGMFGGSTNQQVTVTIKADGSAQILTETVLARQALEQQMRMMDYYRQMQETGDEETPARRTPPEPKPYADDELAKAIRNTFERQEGETVVKVADVQVASNSVRLAYAISLATLNDLVQSQQLIWSTAGLYFEKTRIETDTEGRVKLTFTPYPQFDVKNWQKEMQRAYKLTGARSVLTLVFPGKVVSSSLPVTNGNSTGLVLDSRDAATIEAVAKAIAAPVTIVAEAGGLKLAQPLDSQTTHRSRRAGTAGAYDALPITDAGAGFVSEPASVTMTTVQWFPDGEKQLQRNQFAYELRNTGLVVRAKLFPPKGRMLLAASQPRVLKAVDNKGRDLAKTADPDGEIDVPEMMMGSPSDTGRAVPVNLQLQLPSPDAQTIGEIQVESIVTTAGKWKELVLTNVQANAESAIDLSPVLPGAHLTITKFTKKKNQQSLQGKITGPEAIRQLDVRFKLPDNERGNSNAYDRNYTVKNGQATRTIQVNSYNYGEGEVTGGTPPALVIRIPEDARRERVRFTLKDLDLY